VSIGTIDTKDPKLGIWVGARRCWIEPLRATSSLALGCSIITEAAFFSIATLEQFR